MTGYDFDKTIYKGDSSTDFFIYMMLTRPYLLLFFPWFIIVGIIYACKFINKKELKQCLFFFVPWYSNIAKIVDKFWKRNANKIQDWYMNQKKDDDIIISASLAFILKPIMETLNIKNWIATSYSVRTGKILGQNCYGEAKVVEFKRLYKKAKLEAFYSDSMSDLPMFKVADKAFFVNKTKINEIDMSKYKD